MQAEAYLKLKVTGLPDDIEYAKKKLRLIFIVTETSQLIHHSENNLAHQFILLLKKEAQH